MKYAITFHPIDHNPQWCHLAGRSPDRNQSHQVTSLLHRPSSTCALYACTWIEKTEFSLTPSPPRKSSEDPVKKSTHPCPLSQVTLGG